MDQAAKKDLEEQKEETNDLSIKNSRLWQKEQIRIQHDKLMKKRKKIIGISQNNISTLPYSLN